MYAYHYKNAHNLNEFQIEKHEVAEPKLEPNDVLVRVKATSFNPVDTKIRTRRTAEENDFIILGWDAAGIIEKVGTNVLGFTIGDEVYYSGNLKRHGSNAEKQAVDYRLIAHKPKSLTFEEASALPLTTLTAYEALFERGFNFTEETKVLIIGGAGGVGSIAVQLLKALTPATVIATASRSETIAWTRSMGADHVIQRNLKDEFAKLNIENVDIIFSTTHTDEYLSIIPDILKPFGHLVVIDDPKSLDIVSFKTKALSVHWEFMFAKSMHDYKPETQGQILKNLTKFVDEGMIKTTKNHVVDSSLEGIKTAHELLESGKTIGKITMTMV